MNIINSELLDRLTATAGKTDRLRINHNLHSSPDSKSQRLLNALEPGTQIPIHKHDNTPETYILLRGRMRVDFYDDNNTITESAILDSREGIYGIDIPAGQLHTVEVLEHGTVIFECKDGPYMAIK